MFKVWHFEGTVSWLIWFPDLPWFPRCLHRYWRIWSFSGTSLHTFPFLFWWWPFRRRSGRLGRWRNRRSWWPVVWAVRWGLRGTCTAVCRSSGSFGTWCCPASCPQPPSAPPCAPVCYGSQAAISISFRTLRVGASTGNIGPRLSSSHP